MSYFDVEEFGVLRRLVQTGEVQQGVGAAVSVEHPHRKRRRSSEDLLDHTNN